MYLESLREGIELKTLILYDSYFGNTEIIAASIAKGLVERSEVSFIKVAEAREEYLKGIDLLIIGSPTRGFQPSDRTKAFLKTLQPMSLNGIKIASFDTRIYLKTIKSKAFRFIVNTGGYAAKSIHRVLIKKGGVFIADPEGFYVTGEEGPLKDGEEARALKWSKMLLEL